MDFLKTFTKKNMARNKKRTVVTIIGVMLSAALICTVAGLSASFMKSLRENEIRTVGNFHAQFCDVPADKLSLITENVHVEEYCITSANEIALNEASEKKSLPFINLVRFDATANDMLAVQLTEGRLPEKEGEIVIPEQINTMCNSHLAVGDTMRLPVGKRMWNGMEIACWYPIITKDNASTFLSMIEESDPDLYEKCKDTTPDETFEIYETREYKVTGIMTEMCSYARNYDNVSVPCIVWSDDRDLTDGEELVSVYVRFDDVKHADEYCDQIQASYDDVSDGVGYTKTDLARLNGSVNDTVNRTFRRIVLVILIVIVSMSVFVITNSFRISVSEKEGQYGMLTSIGATKKQIKKTVYAEGALIGIIGTLSGILLGILVMLALVAIVNYLMSDLLSMHMVFAFPWWVALLTALMTAITIYFSCMIPARAAAKIPPIEAIRGNRDYNAKLTGKKLKTSNMIRRLFGVGGVIASKNLKRSRRKYRTTVVSLVLGVAAFVGLSSFINLGESAVRTQYTSVEYDLMANMMLNPEVVENGVEKTASVWKKVSGLPHVDRLYTYQYTDFYLSAEAYGSEEVWNDPEGQFSLGVVLMSDEDFREYAKKVGVKEKDMENAVILADDYTEYGEKTKIYRLTNLSEGDSFHGELEVSENGDLARKPMDLTVAKVTDVHPIGYETLYGGNRGLIAVPASRFAAYSFPEQSGAFIKSDDAEAAETEITDLMLTDEAYGLQVYVYNLKEEASQMKRVLITVSIFLYGFVIVITLIGVTNVINTISTDMNFRAREFAMLKSVGMSGREFNRMIRLESLMYGAKSLAIGLPIGVLIAYALNKAFSGFFEVAFQLPLVSMLISVLAVALIVGFTMHLSLVKINRQNIIETIRKQTL